MMEKRLPREKRDRSAEFSQTEHVILRAICTEVLLPGSTGKAKLSDLDWTNIELLELDDEITIHDLNGNCCLFPDERFQVMRFADSGYWEPIGEYLRAREAVADGDIAVDGSGTVSVWKAGADTQTNVTAHHDWMTGSSGISSGDELLLQYFPGKEHWSIVNAGCSS